MRVPGVICKCHFRKWHDAARGLLTHLNPCNLHVAFSNAQGNCSLYKFGLLLEPPTYYAGCPPVSALPAACCNQSRQTQQQCLHGVLGHWKPGQCFNMTAIAECLSFSTGHHTRLASDWLSCTCQHAEACKTHSDQTRMHVQSSNKLWVMSLWLA